MAYVFSKVDDMLGGQQQKTDIFDQSQGGQNQQNQNQQGQQNQGEEKTSAEGAISSGGGGGGQSAQQGQAPSQAGTSIAKTQGAKAQTPAFMQKAQGDIASATQNLQNEANQYVQGAQQKHYTLGNDVLQNAQKGDNDAYSQVASRLSNQAPDQYEAFNPQTQTSFQDVNALQNDASTKALLAKQAGGQYSQGEGALDMSIMKRNPQFNLLRQQLQQGQAGLQSQAQQFATDKTKEANDAVAANYAADTKGIQDQLGTQAQAIRDQLAQRAAAENAKRQAINPTEYADQQAQAALQELSNDPSAQFDTSIGKRYGLNDFINPNEFYGNRSASPNDESDKAQIDPASQYYKAASQVSPEQFASADDANQFNSLMTLLNKDDRLQAGSVDQGPQFDKEAFKQNVLGTAKQRFSDDQARAQATLDAVKAHGGKTIEDFQGNEANNLFRGGYQTKKADVQNAYKRLGAMLPDQYK